MGGVSIMRISMSVTNTEFKKECQAAIEGVRKGTKAAAEEACKDILKESLNEVPRDTQTLATSAFYDIQEAYNGFVGIVGYGGNDDPTNPKSGVPASDYMIRVHEDLEAYHPIGKAKFLEDPVNRYEEKLPRTFSENVRKFISNLFRG